MNVLEHFMNKKNVVIDKRLDKEKTLMNQKQIRVTVPVSIDREKDKMLEIF